MRFKYTSARDFGEYFCFSNTFFLSLSISPAYSTNEEGEVILPLWLDKHEDKAPLWGWWSKMVEGA